MTGVQTCALPICFPVTIGGGDYVVEGFLVLEDVGFEVGFSDD